MARDTACGPLARPRVVVRALHLTDMRGSGVGEACHRDAPAFDERVRSSQGYRVDSPGGRIGRVDSTRYGSDGSLQALLVSQGLIRKRLVEVPIDDVEWVLPHVRRLLLGVDRTSLNGFAAEPARHTDGTAVRYADGAAVLGYQVVTFDGDTVGTVVALSEHSIMIRHGRGPFRTCRLLPSRLTVVRERDHSVVALVTAASFFGAPKIKRGQRFDDDEVARHYESVSANYTTSPLP